MNHQFDRSRGQGQRAGGGPRRPDDAKSPEFKPLTSTPEVLIASAEKWGTAWEQARLPASQLRKYFGEVRRIEQLISMKGEPGWNEHKLEFKLIKAKAAYALRDKARERRALVDFLQQGVDQVSSLDDFKLFSKYFEAAVGFANLKDK